MSSFMRNWEMVISTYDKDVLEDYKILDTRTLTELRVVFQLQNTFLGDPSTGSLQLYNIAGETKSMLTSGACICSISTSYGTDALSLLFRGEVTNSYELRQDTDTIQQVWLRDTGIGVNDFIPQIDSFESEVKPESLLSKLIDVTPYVSGPSYIGNTKSVMSSAPTLDDYVFSGSFKEELDNLLIPLGLRWFVQFGVVNILNESDINAGESSAEFKVSRQGGLLTRPVVSYVGVKFEHLMSPAFQPGKLVEIVPNTVRYDLGPELYVDIDTSTWKASGLFRVKEVTHRGDTRGGKWQSDVYVFYED